MAPGHPCGRLHGHTFHVRITVRGPVHPVAGWVMDFAEIMAAWMPLHGQLDHQVLNDVPGLENPTSEQLAMFIWRGLHDALPLLFAVEVGETGGFRVVYRGD